MTIPEKPPRVHKRVFHKHSEVKKTEQQHKDEVNVNTIMNKAIRTGMAPQVKGFYGDFTGIEDYHTSMNKIIAAQKGFMTLPANIRKRFENCPGQLIEFLNNAENEKEAMELGIIPRPPINAPAEPQEPVASATDQTEAREVATA